MLRNIVFTGIIILSILLLLSFVALVLSEPNEPEPTYNAEAVESEKIYADPNAVWVFEGTFCSKCKLLYNYIEHPKVCDKCGEQTKDFYYLVLIKERK